MTGKNYPISQVSSPENDVAVVARDEIPAIHSIEQNGETHYLGEVRDFQWHDTLKEFFPPSSEFSISWVCLKKDEMLPKHTHPIQTMMVFYQGSGAMLGQNPRSVQEGDVVVVPTGSEHGFIGGPEGLYAFSIQFGSGLYTNPQQPRVLFSEGQKQLAVLKKYNEQCARKFVQRPFFTLLKDGSLEDPKKLEIFLNCMNTWLRIMDATWFSRRDDQSDFFDPVLESLVDWFSYQMLVLDYAEKAVIIYWVIELASRQYHALAKASVSAALYKKYFHQHFTLHAKCQPLDEVSLHNLSRHSYHRLKEIIILSWNTLEAMIDRVFELTSSIPSQGGHYD